MRLKIYRSCSRLPHWILVTDSDSREGQFVLVGDGQVDLGRVGQKIQELGDDQVKKTSRRSQGHYHPGQAEISTVKWSCQTYLFHYMDMIIKVHESYTTIK